MRFPFVKTISKSYKKLKGNICMWADFTFFNFIMLDLFIFAFPSALLLTNTLSSEFPTRVSQYLEKGS